MKKRSLITKLALSGVALAATAATLATSTYAWYTTNTSVDANGVTGSSASSGDASIFISKDGSTNWQQSISFTAEEFKNLAMIPVQLSKTDGALYPLTSAGALSATAATTKVDYLEFSLFFKTAATSKNVPLYLQSLTIKNTKDTLVEYDNLLNGQTSTTDRPLGIDGTSAKYTKDIVNAISYTITSDISETTYGDKNTEFTKLDGKTAYNPTKVSGWVSSIKENGSATDAHAYYEAVSNKKLTSGQKTEDATDGVANQLVACLNSDGTAAKVTFRFYLNGTDKDCFDACKGQTFTVDFKFNSTGSSSN